MAYLLLDNRLAGATLPSRRRIAATKRRTRVTDNVREHLERILASYEEINRRFAEVGGIGKLLGLFEDVKRELERVSDQELDRVTGEIKSVVEDLLKVDYELRKVQNLKLLFEQRRPEAPVSGDESS
jgi:hypothetical protein